MMSPSSPLKNTLVAYLAPDRPLPAGRPASTDENVRKAAKRLRLWELKEKHHCPVIGTCLPIEELAKFARRFFCLVDSRDEFSMHVEAVSHANTRNAVSEAIQKYLERKYQAQIRYFDQAKCDPEVLAAWQKHYAHGEVAGALWAAITHKAVSAETQQRIFADVHMLSHQIGAGQAADVRQLAKLERDYASTRA